jgi:hypothetical protein
MVITEPEGEQELLHRCAGRSDVWKKNWNSYLPPRPSVRTFHTKAAVA